MLPKGYKEWIERVSNIVSFAFPFKGTEDEVRYLNWLENNWIKEEEYLSLAQELGTEVHNSIESYIKWEVDLSVLDLVDRNTVKEISYWIDYIQSLNKDWIDYIETEKYVCDKNKRYQGTCDLLYKIREWETVLADWKTYWICKKKFPQLKKKEWTPAIATKKKNKVHLQMSLYAKALRETEWIIVDKIQLLFLHEEGLKIVDLIPIPDEQIESLLRDYYEHKILSLNPESMSTIKITAPFKIHLQTAPQAYQNISVDLDFADLPKETSIEEACIQAVALQKYLANQFK